MSHLNYFHHLQAEADEINSTGHRLLDYVGGAVSLEMQMPKLLWLKVDGDNIMTIIYQQHYISSDTDLTSGGLLPSSTTWPTGWSTAPRGRTPGRCAPPCAREESLASYI